MTAEEFRTLVKRQPFRPLRLHLQDGTTLDVLDPRLVLVSRLTIVVGTPDPECPGAAERTTRIGPDFIDRVKDLAQTRRN
jgi:hypothetical protein